MYSLFEGASLKMAKNLIRVTGVQETLTLFREKNLSNVGMEELLIQVLSLNACNLFQTMKEDFVDREIDSEDQADIVDDYVIENLRMLGLANVKDGADLMEKCQDILGIAEKLQVYWTGEEDRKGPGPRYYCVKDVLRRLGNEKNFELHDALFEFMYTQHKHFIHYFKTLLDPIEPPAAPEGTLPTLPPETPAASEPQATARNFLMADGEKDPE
jgi:hypothetical protein